MERRPGILSSHRVAQPTSVLQQIWGVSALLHVPRHPDVSCLLKAASGEAEAFASGPQDAVNLGELLL